MPFFIPKTKRMRNVISEIQLKYKPAQNKQKRIKITDSQTAYRAFLELWNKDTLELQEEFNVLLLNRANEVLGMYNLSKGGITATIVDLKLLFAVVLKAAASSIILAHNHPSGNIFPSMQDKELNKKIKTAAKYLEITVLDNLILSKENYWSFADEGT